MKVILFITFLMFIVTSCASMQEAGQVLRNEKIKTTDEFLVKKKQPLILPPDYDKIPEPGSSNKTQNNDKDKIRKNTLINLKEIKNKIFKIENFYFLILLLFIFSIDRYSKIKIVENLSDNIFFINEFLNFDLVWNTGIGFGLLSFNSSFYYNSISLLIFAVIIFLIFLGLKSDKFDKTIFSVIIGGALGNFYDRITFKAVPDFIDFHYGNFHWFTFNAADIFITIGIICFIMKEIFIKNN